MDHKLESFINKAQENYGPSKSQNFDLSFLSKNILIVEKWNWPYKEALSFQKDAVNFVQENSKYKIFIFCNHPHCFTMGHGLQKEKGKRLNGLYETGNDLLVKLKFPIHKIKRGGGLTFHYPGQWIFYPIIHLNSNDLSVPKLIDQFLKTIRQTLKENYKLTTTYHQKKFLGLWKDNHKLASIGVGIDRMVTYHGIALNIRYDELMFNELRNINPCGLKSSTYICLEDLLNIFPYNKNDLLLNYHKNFIQNLDCHLRFLNIS